LGSIISIEMGKILQEGLGEVQEVIDICEFAVGLSRQLYGLSIASERAEHKLLETWHPLGPVAIISAFNFPMAVWAWNAALALVCGNTLLWKPSEKTPLSALALHALLVQAAHELKIETRGLSSLIIGERAAGEQLVMHPAVRLVSATGSTGMGLAVGEACARHFKRSLLELGGNNAAILASSADLELALRGITFSAVGTAGQRCTSLRRLFVHRSIYLSVVNRLKAIYESIPIGDPLQEGTLVGPLIDRQSLARMEGTLDELRRSGAQVHFGERVAIRGSEAYYVRPALVEMTTQGGPMLEETFAPILYLCPYDELAEARSTMPSSTACLPPYSREICTKPSSSSQPAGRIAVSPTSISVPAAPRSAVRSVGRRRLGAVVNPVPTPGRTICVARPTPSTTASPFPSRRASGSMSEGSMAWSARP
jgi:aldehyde dehydrogenase (NAD+)